MKNAIIKAFIFVSKLKKSTSILVKQSKVGLVSCAHRILSFQFIKSLNHLIYMFDKNSKDGGFCL